MDFTEPYKKTGECVWSPDAQYLATSADYRLLIRKSETLQIERLYSCLDRIDHVVWSPDSLFVMCSMEKRGVIQVWSIENEDWTCKIDEGSAGLQCCRWSPDSRHIITTSEFELRLTVWSLVNRSVFYIRFPKAGVQGTCFSADGNFMAVAERSDCKDFIGIYSTKTWSQMHHFPVESRDLASITWSPDDRAICVVDSMLDYNVLLYTPDGRLVNRYRAYENALGVKAAVFSPSSQLLAIGSYDQKLRIMNHINWKVLIEFEHSFSVDLPRAVVYKEYLEEIKGGTRSHFEIEDMPCALPSIKVFPEKPNPKMGVGKIVWSHDSSYVATINDNMPKVVWVWEIMKLELVSVIIQEKNVKECQWDPSALRLSICTGSPTVYFWTPEGCSCVEIPTASFDVHKLAWNKKGSSLTLIDKDRFCCCFPESA